MHRRPRPELLALLSDVKDHPDDRTPWLVLTDWLEEHGDEADQARAEYCRLCLPKMGLTKVTAAHYDLGERRRDLFRQWSLRWFGPLLACQPQQENGLFSITGDSSIARILAAYDEDPEPFAWVYKATLFLDDYGFLGKPSGFWSEVRVVDLRNTLDASRLLTFLEAPRIYTLHHLQAYLIGLTDAEADQIVRAFLDHSIRRLRLLHVNISPATLARMKEQLGERLVLL